MYIVASQAHTVSNGSIDVLNTILQKGADRFEQTLSPNYWNNLGQTATSNDFRSRFFTYSTDQESLRSGFEKDLRSLLLKLPEIIKVSAVDYIKDYAKDAKINIEKSLQSFREILLEREEKKKKLEKIEANELQRIYENENKKAEIIQKIKEFSQKASVDITNSYNTILTVDNIIQFIEKNGWSKKEEDMKQLSAKLSNLLNDSYTSVLKKYSKELSYEVDVFLQNFENTTKIFTSKDGVEVDSGFNVKASFAGGLAGLVTYGALSVWAASLGNLGAYILVAKGVSVLAAMGISVGGTAAASAAIGGPIVIVIRIATILASLVYVMFSGSWKKAISKKIVNAYDKKNVLANYLTQNTTYWNDTEKAFKHASGKLEKDFEYYIANLKKEVYESDDEDVKAKIALCESNIRVCNLLLKI